MDKRNTSILELAGNIFSSSLLKKGFIVLFGAISATIFSQQIVKGTIVSSADGKPVSSVVVKIANSDVQAETDEKGNFNIMARPEDVLVLESSDFTSQEITVGKKTSFSIKLKKNLHEIDEVVVIGYGKQKKSDITGSVAVVKIDDIKKTETSDISKMLQGQVSGVTVQSAGDPGSDVNIKIRGISSFGNNNPLYVIDGVIVNNPSDFSPSDVESIQVLKDASAAAIYGVRGANGVIIIQTKQGKKGKTNIAYKAINGYQTVPKKISVTNRAEYQQITNQAYINAGLPILSGNDPSSVNYINNVDTNWQNEGFRTGSLQNHSLNLSGGGENFSVSVNLDYFKNSAYLQTPQAYERYTSGINFSGKKGDKFKYGGKMSYVQADRDRFSAYDNGSSLIYLLQSVPTMPLLDPNRLGGYGGTDSNTQAAISLNIIGYNNLVQNTAKRYRFLGDVWGEYEILKNLKYKLDVSVDRLNVHSRYYVPQSDLGWYYVTEENEAQLDISDNSLQTTYLNNLLTYDFSLGKHKFSLLAGWIQQKDDYYNHWSRGVGYVAGAIPQLEYAKSRDAGEYNSHTTSSSYIGRINYNYDEKYLLTANFRQDKSSLFAPKNNHGEYFSFSAGWRLDKEEFLHLPKEIKLLKLRGGWGKLGNNTLGVYAWENTVNPFAGYIFGGSLQPGSAVTTIKDPDVKWETTESSNVALEMNISNKFDFTAEYYVKKSYDLLAQVPIPYSSGGYPNSILTNAADVKNSGWEFSLGYKEYSKEFKFGINTNLGLLDNKVLKLGPDNNPIYGVAAKTEVGRSIGEIYGWVSEGLFQNTTEVQNHATQVGAQPGDVKFKDLNGDGIIDDNDRTYLGRSIPKFTYGFNFNASYKKFDFSMFWQGQAGNYIYNGTYSSLMIGQLTNHSTDLLNYWTSQNTNTNIPRPVMYDPNGNGRASDRFVEKGDYLKLQTLEIGYTLPVSAEMFSKVRIFASGQNLWTITKYKGYDPDFQSDGLFSRGYEYGSFPSARTFSFGLEVNF